MKGIILVGGTGTRLYPSTKVLNKHLLQVFDKPMVYYALAHVMSMGVRDILFVVDGPTQKYLTQLLGQGTHLGCRFRYRRQENPGGIAEAFLLGEDFVSGEPVLLMLGDNFLYGDNFQGEADQLLPVRGAKIFAYRVSKTEGYGVVHLDGRGNPISISEKPKEGGGYAVPGLYLYDHQAMELAKQIKRSPRGEMEITSLHEAYLQQKQLYVEKLPKGLIWFDMGIPSALHEAAQYVSNLLEKKNIYVGCIEQVAYQRGYIDRTGLAQIIDQMPSGAYRSHLHSLL
ncbi:MAG: sugar phosphate nucleotidyltransferase [Cytophagales bacterium]|nr:sugar phosphate nucleotidyltransferase [Cytophagales bacterium]